MPILQHLPVIYGFQKAPLNVGRYGLMAAMVNNEIWIAGGIIETKTRTIDIYNGFVAATTVAAAAKGTNTHRSGFGAGGVGDGGHAADNGSGDNFAAEATKSTIVDVITDTMEYYSLKCAYIDEYVSDMLPMAKVNDVNGDAAPVAIPTAGVVDGGGGMLPPTIGRLGGGVEVGRWIKAKQRLRIPR